MTQESSQSTLSVPAQDQVKTADERIRSVAIMLAILGAIVCLRPIWGATAQDRLLQEAASLLMSERFAEAEDCAQQVLERDSNSPLASVIAGEAAIRRDPLLSERGG